MFTAQKNNTSQMRNSLSVYFNIGSLAIVRIQCDRNGDKGLKISQIYDLIVLDILKMDIRSAVKISFLSLTLFRSDLIWDSSL